MMARSYAARFVVMNAGSRVYGASAAGKECVQERQSFVEGVAPRWRWQVRNGERGMVMSTTFGNFLLRKLRLAVPSLFGQTALAL